jgi:hypothetical protein
MIKINLAKKKEEKELKPAVGRIPQISLPIQKEKAIYYLSVILWISFALTLLYYLKLHSDMENLRKQLEELNAQKVQLQVKAKKFAEEKKLIENNIRDLENRIRDIDKSKDIIVGLKSYYVPFNNTFLFHVKSVPSVSWISSYKESLDINTSLIKAELELQSLDYYGISNYTKKLASLSRAIEVSSVERKTNQYGFEYYSAKLSTEKTLYGGKGNAENQ